jgi:hypothetical protein
MFGLKEERTMPHYPIQMFDPEHNLISLKLIFEGRVEQKLMFRLDKPHWPCMKYVPQWQDKVKRPTSSRKRQFVDQLSENEHKY